MKTTLIKSLTVITIIATTGCVNASNFDDFPDTRKLMQVINPLDEKTELMRIKEDISRDFENARNEFIKKMTNNCSKKGNGEISEYLRTGSDNFVKLLNISSDSKDDFVKIRVNNLPGSIEVKTLIMCTELFFIQKEVKKGLDISGELLFNNVVKKLSLDDPEGIVKYNKPGCLIM